MGNSAKPTALKLIAGNPGKRPINKSEPKPKAAAPKMPVGFSQKQKTLWGQLCKILSDMNVLTLADGKALEQLCIAYDHLWEAQKEIKEDGFTYWTTSEAPLLKPNPAVAMASDAQKRIKSFMVDFGLTPASRTKINAETKPKSDPLEEYLKR